MPKAEISFAPVLVKKDEVGSHENIYNVVPKEAEGFYVVSVDDIPLLKEAMNDERHERLLPLLCNLRKDMSWDGERQSDIRNILSCRHLSDREHYVNTDGKLVSYNSLDKFLWTGKGEHDDYRMALVLDQDMAVIVNTFDTQQFVYRLLLWSGGFIPSRDVRNLQDTWARQVVQELSILTPIITGTIQFDTSAIRSQSRRFMDSMVILARTCLDQPHITRTPRDIMLDGTCLRKWQDNKFVFLSRKGSWLSMEDVREVGFAYPLVCCLKEDDSDPDTRFMFDAEAKLGGEQVFMIKEGYEALDERIRHMFEVGKIEDTEGVDIDEFLYHLKNKDRAT